LNLATPTPLPVAAIEISREVFIQNIGFRSKELQLALVLLLLSIHFCPPHYFIITFISARELKSATSIDREFAELVNAREVLLYVSKFRGACAKFDLMSHLGEKLRVCRSKLC
jgi:hypothetical protein